MKKRKRKNRNKKRNLNFKSLLLTLIAIAVVLVLVFLELYWAEKGEREFLKKSQEVTSLEIEEIDTKNQQQNDSAVNAALEEEYNKQLTASLGKDYETYKKLANLYLREGRYEEGVDLVENIKLMSPRKIISIKKDFYKTYGDILFEDRQFLESIEAYDKAMIYRKRFDKKLPLDEIKDNVFEAYIELSLQEVQSGEYSSAINYLNTALNYKRAAEIYYKLALLYMNIDLKKALQYFEATKKLDPNIINYNLYMNTLVRLKHQAKSPAEISLYQIKENNLKRYVNQIKIEPNEFTVTFKKPKTTKKWYSKNKKVDVDFVVKSNSEFITRQLFFQIEVLTESNIVLSQEIQVASKIENIPIEGDSTIKTISFEVPKKCKSANIKILGTKNHKVPSEEIITQNITFD